jgi:hypothetical protein
MLLLYYLLFELTDLLPKPTFLRCSFSGERLHLLRLPPWNICRLLWLFPLSSSAMSNVFPNYHSVQATFDFLPNSCNSFLLGVLALVYDSFPRVHFASWLMFPNHQENLLIALLEASPWLLVIFRILSKPLYLLSKVLFFWPLFSSSKFNSLTSFLYHVHHQFRPPFSSALPHISECLCHAYHQEHSHCKCRRECMRCGDIRT